MWVHTSMWTQQVRQIRTSLDQIICIYCSVSRNKLYICYVHLSMRSIHHHEWETFRQRPILHPQFFLCVHLKCNTNLYRCVVLKRLVDWTCSVFIEVHVISTLPASCVCEGIDAPPSAHCRHRRMKNHSSKTSSFCAARPGGLIKRMHLLLYICIYFFFVINTPLKNALAVDSFPTALAEK